jgi:hypothetical protein
MLDRIDDILDRLAQIEADLIDGPQPVAQVSAVRRLVRDLRRACEAAEARLAAVAKVEEELREDAYTHLQSAREQSARVATRAADLLAAALKGEG